MSIEQDRNRLAQAEMLEELRRDRSTAEMLTVYLEQQDNDCLRSIYCALIPSKQIDKVLDTLNWDLMHDDGLPDSVEYLEESNRKIDYLRYGNTKGIEPLVIDRKFHGIREDYLEISEEFRLFHRLYHDGKSNQYVKIDEGGDEQVVAVVEPNHVKIRLKEIRQFLAIKEMHLSIQFDCREHSEYTLGKLGLIEGNGAQQDGLCCWSLRYGEAHFSSQHALSRLYGKRLIEPLPKSKSGFSGFAEKQKKEHVDFITGVDDDGDEIKHSCAAPGDLYLTPVSFRKQVLDEYYQHSKYRVSDSALWCGTLWMIQIDNHHDDKVCAWLGDLGRDLPYKEQQHWRRYNFASETGVSETYYHRQIGVQFIDSNRPEHIFQQCLNEVKKISQKQLGWQLLLSLKPDDEHHLQSIRIPSTDEQRDFDELILGLTKILVDSLNEERLNALILRGQGKSPPGSISRLEAALAACGVNDASEHISFLRKLQKLRSTGSAHRKGDNYEKIAKEFGVESQGLRTVFTGILQKAIVFLDYLIQLVESNRISQEPKTKHKPDALKGQIWLAPDFDETPQDVIDSFYNSKIFPDKD